MRNTPISAAISFVIIIGPGWRLLSVIEDTRIVNGSIGTLLRSLHESQKTHVGVGLEPLVNDLLNIYRDFWIRAEVSETSWLLETRR